MEDNKSLKPLIIVDGFGFIFRAYHTQPPLTSPAGFPVGAIYGFVSMLLRLIADFKPENAVIVLDHSGKNFRHDIYKDYKSNRPPAPDDLVVQLKFIEQAARALNFECISKFGYEADDIIATLASKATTAKKDAVIISSDKDLMQLLNDYVQIYDPVKSKFIQKDDVVAKFGVEPEKVRDVQALMGDSSDNIPGVSGFGPKIAASLINQFGSFDAVLSSVDQIKSKRQQDLLRAHLDDARISWQLVGLDQNVNLEHTIDSFKWSSPSVENISNFLSEYGFKSLNKRIESLFNLKIHEYQPIENEYIKEKKDIKINKITSDQEFKNFMDLVECEGVVSVLLDRRDNNVDFIFALKNKLYLVSYVCEDQSKQIFFDFDQNNSSNLSFSVQIERLFSDSSIRKIIYNLKELIKLCNFTCKSFEDLQLMDYILNAGKTSRNLHQIVNDLVNKPIFNGSELYEVSPYLIDCYIKLKSELFQNKLSHLYYDIDLPLCYILNGMEKEGVKIDIQYLKNLSENFGQKISELEKKIYQLTGEKFNIASPKQLGEVLFGKMQLPFAKITGKNKSFVTSADILEKLYEKGFEVAGFLLEWRHLIKLKNTYTDTLPKQVNKDTGRVHTTFLQAVTATGRLSSTNPNVQNIPTRTEEGSSIRAAFIANQGKKLISADYSQIELRILSHVANIDSLKKAMSNNRDIHLQTASQIFSTPIDRIDSELRRKAKAINFGIIYGISSFGLAKQLNISKKEASDYIQRYFKEYPGIQKYMSDTIEYAKENGYVKNLLGRKCFIPTINDKNHTYRSFGERAAINAPMQSLASDIVKIAMIKLDSELKKRSMQTKMILQIHDELIFEAPDYEVDEVIKMIKERMESAICLDVKTDVEINYGNNWKEIH